MKRIVVLALLAACGGSSPEPAKVAPPTPLPPVPQGQFADPAPQTNDATPTATVPAPAPSPPPPPPPRPVVERLRDEGPVAGMEGWTLKHVADPTYCTGIKIVTVRGKRKVAPDDKPLVDVYALAFPTNVNFDPKDHKAAEASKKKVDDWITKTLALMQTATQSYEAKLAPGGDVSEAMRAAARVAQLNYRFASLLARAPIAKDVRTGDFKEDKIAAYCDYFAENAEAFAERAEEAIAACAQKLDPASTDWPATVCRP